VGAAPKRRKPSGTAASLRAHEPEDGEKKARPHPGLLPQEKESLFPRLVNLSALRLRVVQGGNARFFRGILSPSAPLTPPTRRGRNARRVLAMSCPGWFRGSMHEFFGEFFFLREKVAAGRMRGKSPWQSQVHQILKTILRPHWSDSSDFGFRSSDFIRVHLCLLPIIGSVVKICFRSPAFPALSFSLRIRVDSR